MKSIKPNYLCKVLGRVSSAWLASATRGNEHIKALLSKLLPLTTFLICLTTWKGTTAREFGCAGRIGGCQPFSPPCYALKRNKISIGEDMAMTASQRRPTTFIQRLIDGHVPSTMLGTVVTKPLRHSPTHKELPAPSGRGTHKKQKKIKYPACELGSLLHEAVQERQQLVPMLSNSRPWCPHCVYCSNHQARLVLPSLHLLKISECPPTSVSSVQTVTHTCFCDSQMFSHETTSNHRAFAKSSQHLTWR